MARVSVFCFNTIESCFESWLGYMSLQKRGVKEFNQSYSDVFISCSISIFQVSNTVETQKKKEEVP